MMARIQNLNRRAIFVAVITIVVIASSPLAMAGETVDDHNIASLADGDIDTADEIYVDDSGDAVLVYGDDQPGADYTEYGFHVAEGLVHILVSDATGDDDLEGQLGVELGPDRFSGEGWMSYPAPDDFEEFDLSISGEQSDEEAWMEASLNVELVDPYTSQQDTDIATDGHVTVTADEFRSEGSVTGTNVFPSAETYYDVAITGLDDGYHIDVSQRNALNDWEIDAWETEASASNTLEQRYGVIADELGGTADVSISEHSLEENAAGATVLDLDYTIEYRGIDEGLTEAISDELAQDVTLGLTDAEADALAADLLALDVRTVAITYESTMEAFDVSWEIDLGNTDRLAQSALDQFEAANEEYTEDIDEARDRFDAAKEASLEQVISWDSTVELSGSDVLIVADVTYETNNWDAYVDALADRDIEGGEVSYELTAELDGEEVYTDATIVVTEESLLDSAIDATTTMLQNEPNADSELIAAFEAFSDADLDTAKMDLAFDDGTVELEAGAKFDDLSAFEDSLTDQFGDHAVTQLYGHTDNGSQQTYVYVSELVDADATEEDVRELAVADASTDVYMSGEWDRSFPEMNTTAAENYLGVDSQDDDGVLPMAGFGPIVTIVSLLLAGGLAVRRHR